MGGRHVDFVVTHMGNDRDILDRKLQAKFLANELKQRSVLSSVFFYVFVKIKTRFKLLCHSGCYLCIIHVYIFFLARIQWFSLAMWPQHLAVVTTMNFWQMAMSRTLMKQTETDGVNTSCTGVSKSRCLTCIKQLGFFTHLLYNFPPILLLLKIYNTVENDQ